MLLQLIAQNSELVLIQGTYALIFIASIFDFHVLIIDCSRFCRIQRKNDITKSVNRHYQLIDNSLHIHQQEYRATILSPTSEELNLYISAQACGSIRVKITEKVHRWQV